MLDPAASQPTSWRSSAMSSGRAGVCMHGMASRTKALREGDRGSATSARAGQAPCRVQYVSRWMFCGMRHTPRHLPNRPRLIHHVQSRLNRDASSTIRNQQRRPLSKTRFQIASKQLVLVASKRWRARIASVSRTKRGSWWWSHLGFSALAPSTRLTSQCRVWKVLT